jgi:hypothetical protein
MYHQKNVPLPTYVTFRNILNHPGVVRVLNTEKSRVFATIHMIMRVNVVGGRP